MLRRLFRGEARRRTIDDLYERVAASSRQSGLYSGLGLPDTLEGRFESLSVHAILLLDRLRALPPPADDVAQEFVDCLFRQLDASLREMGVGDLAVPKRMKRLAEAFYERTRSYGPPVEAEDAAGLAEIIAANVGIVPGVSAAGLAGYILASRRELARQDLDALLGEGPSFARPEVFLQEASP